MHDTCRELKFTSDTTVADVLLAIRNHFLPKTREIYRIMMKARYPEFIAPIEVASLGVRAGVIGAARLPRL